MDRIATHLADARRALVRAPAFSTVALLTLGVGVGAVTAMFTVLDRVALRPLPYPEADRLVRVESVVPRQDPTSVWGISEAGYFYFGSEARTIADIGAVDDAFERVTLAFSGPQGVMTVPGDSVTATTLSLLGARPAMGRLLAPSDEARGAPPVVVLSHDLWRGHFGGDTAIVGQSVRIGGVAREVIGVTEPGFGMPDRRGRAWVPLPLDSLRPATNDHWVGAIARLAPGATLAEAQAEVDHLTSQLPVRFPEAYSPDFMEEYGFATRLVPLRAKVTGGVGRTLWALLAGVGLLLLTALSNVAGLFLVRGEARRGELAVRTALGARPARLLAESLTQGVLLGLAAGVLGLVIAAGALEAVVALSPPALPRISEIRLGWAAIGFALGTAVVAGGGAGLAPWLWTRPDLDALRMGGRGSTASPAWRRFRRGLVGAQIALAFVLVAGVGLSLRSFHQLMSADPGYDGEGVLTFQLFLPESPYLDFAASAAFYRELTERLEALPSVARAGAVEALPLQPLDGCWTTFPAGAEVPPDVPFCINVLAFSPGYLEAMGIPIIQGRSPAWSEAEAGTGEIVVTRSLADRYWPGEDPVGKTLRGFSWGDAPAYRVVGVAADFHADGVDRPTEATAFVPIRPMIGTPLHWGPYWGVHRQLQVVVKSGSTAPERLAPAVREILGQLDTEVVPGPFESFEQVRDRSPSISRATLLSTVLAQAAAIALFLSGVALYGVVAHVVRQRTREIGLRVALGADVRQIVEVVLMEAASVGAVGIAAGLLGAVAVGRTFDALLFGVRASDPLALGGTAALLGAVVVIAAIVPARRALRIDPSEALRTE